jgi:hypothetical protein
MCINPTTYKIKTVGTSPSYYSLHGVICKPAACYSNDRCVLINSYRHRDYSFVSGDIDNICFRLDSDGIIHLMATILAGCLSEKSFTFDGIARWLI